MKPRLADESGVSLIELIISMFLLTILVAGLSNVFVSGLRASSDTTARTAGQGNIQTAVNRLEYELRCSSGATVPNAGVANSSVTLTLPTECVHTTQTTYTWCVTNGSLIRYAAATCTGTGETLATNVTTATPFTLIATTGNLPQLAIDLTVDLTNRSSDAVSVADTITLRNAART